MNNKITGNKKKLVEVREINAACAMCLFPSAFKNLPVHFVRYHECEFRKNFYTCEYIGAYKVYGRDPKTGSWRELKPMYYDRNHSDKVNNCWIKDLKLALAIAMNPSFYMGSSTI